MGCAGNGLCHDGACVCALGFAGPDCATSTAPNAHDCSLGCVHLCSSRCAAARVAAPAAERSPAERAAGADCFGTCRKRCAESCRTHSAQRRLWLEGARPAPTAMARAATAASAALGKPIPTAGALPPFERQLADTLPPERHAPSREGPTSRRAIPVR